jgi:hypothetical protein
MRGGVLATEPLRHSRADSGAETRARPARRCAEAPRHPCPVRHDLMFGRICVLVRGTVLVGRTPVLVGRTHVLIGTRRGPVDTRPVLVGTTRVLVGTMPVLMGTMPVLVGTMRMPRRSASFWRARQPTSRCHILGSLRASSRRHPSMFSPASLTTQRFGDRRRVQFAVRDPREDEARRSRCVVLGAAPRPACRWPRGADLRRAPHRICGCRA